MPIFHANSESATFDENKNQNQNRKQKGKTKRLEIRPQQKTFKPKLNLPQITSVAEKIEDKIKQFKNQHTLITKSLQQAITQNNLYRSVSASELQKQKDFESIDSKNLIKQKSLLQLQKSIQRKLKNDKQSDMRLRDMQDKVNQKKNAIAKQLTEIQSRNLNKIKEINQLQKKILTKIQEEIGRDLEKQKRLKKELQRITYQSLKLAKLKKQENQRDRSLWKEIISRKLNLERRLQNQITVKNKSEDQTNPQVSSHQQKKGTISKEEDRKNNRKREKIDAKQAGRQYLDFAKRNAMNGARLKNNLMNINLKVINYGNQILDRIGHNDGSLSKKYPELDEDVSKVSNSRVKKLSSIQKVLKKSKQTEINHIQQHHNQSLANSLLISKEGQKIKENPFLN